ncbi:shikimate dehydrogenase [Alkalicaulis satelles]|uniref:Shikimate dehydrogenase (NADP(+)) n=1 Tax=Alkalicaulis satelles TaxID=2609175 RepID=A0A5M6ZGI7_9PROT|nr:shikimate dehydrogenase [Alkalicaulis satelles]KAA5803829.1 shikimate dehydrogenase [Alkalicaulis satelles]
MSGAGPRAGVCGWPVDHSLSPLMMSAWLKAARLPGSYDKLPVAAHEFEARVRGLAAEGYAGLNVTIPHKEQALALADEASAAAIAVGAANLLVFRGGRVLAGNTDIDGLDAALAGDDGTGPAVLIGAGGAARAALWRLSRQDRDIRIVNRTIVRARALAEAFGLDVDIYDKPAATVLKDARLIINATSMGMSGQPQLEAALEAVAPDALVFDMVYTPLETGLLRQAKALGLRTSDGLAMLIGQARPSFEAFFGAPPPDDDSVRALLEAALEARA